jgi:hypothetical protein
LKVRRNVEKCSFDAKLAAVGDASWGVGFWQASMVGDVAGGTTYLDPYDNTTAKQGYRLTDLLHVCVRIQQLPEYRFLISVLNLDL